MTIRVGFIVGDSSRRFSCIASPPFMNVRCRSMYYNQGELEIRWQLNSTFADAASSYKQVTSFRVRHVMSRKQSS